MSYLVLARKYRPQTFAEVLEQGHITRTLSNALSAGRVAHALLFAGPRGTGKTTIARILAKALNCQAGPAAAPCNQCRSCQDITAGRAVDVYEIDGASNNSVDQVRELRENVKYMPAHSRYKIYIIDEVHMLSTAAFNALLKTLEEPPAHVLFMFATTEPHKIPITILSRCQRFDLRRIRLLLDRRSSDVGLPQGRRRDRRREPGADRPGVRRQRARQPEPAGPGHLGRAADASPTSRSLKPSGSSTAASSMNWPGPCWRAMPLPFLATLDDIFDRGHDLKKLFSDLLEYLRDLWVIQTSRSPEKLVDLPDHEIERMQDQAGRTPRASCWNTSWTFSSARRPPSGFRPSPSWRSRWLFSGCCRRAAVLSIDTLITKLEDLRREVQGAGPFRRRRTRERPTKASAGQETPDARSAP